MRTTLAALLLVFAVSRASAQTTEADLAARLIGKPLLIRGFWLDDDLKFDAVGKPLKAYKTGSFTESAMDVTTVHIRGHSLIVEGKRVGLIFNEQGEASRVPLLFIGAFRDKPERVTIEIDQDGADFAPALGEIFTESLADITPTLPACWQRFAHEHFLHEPPPPKPSPADPVDSDSATHRGKGDKVKAPKMLSSSDPSFTQAARGRKFSGNVVIHFWLERDGTISDLSIVKPAGLGLDESAVAALTRYRFAPATQNGIPVRFDLAVVVNFQIL